MRSCGGIGNSVRWWEDGKLGSTGCNKTQQPSPSTYLLPKLHRPDRGPTPSAEITVREAIPVQSFVEKTGCMLAVCQNLKPALANLGEAFRCSTGNINGWPPKAAFITLEQSGRPTADIICYQGSSGI